MTTRYVIALTVGLFTASSAAAGESCTCRANGMDVEEGQTACLVTASGPQMARCEKVLNNTSWKFLALPCPSADLSTPDNTLQSLQSDVASLTRKPAILPE